MARIANVLLLASLAMAAATRSYSLGKSLRRGKHHGKMNPEAVAHTLSSVEGKWMTQAVAFVECNTTDTACKDDTMGEFQKSCQTVVRSLLQGSDGDKSNVAEYMGDICGQQDLHGWKKDMCNNFATALNQALTDDNLVNRDDLPVDKICTKFLDHGFLRDAAKDEIAKAEKEKEREIAQEQEEAKKEAEKKAAEEAAEAKEREAAAKAEAAKEADELAAKIQEQAKAKAAEAAQKASASSPAVNVTMASNSSTESAVSSSSSTESAVASNSSAPEVSPSTTVAANGTDASPSSAAENGTVAAVEPTTVPASNGTAVATPSNTTK